MRIVGVGGVAELPAEVHAKSPWPKRLWHLHPRNLANTSESLQHGVGGLTAQITDEPVIGQDRQLLCWKENREKPVVLLIPRVIWV